MESQFTSPFWHYYIVAIVVASFIYVTWLLLSQDKVKLKKGEEVKTTGHSWDGIEEYNNPMPRWWFWMFIMTILFGIGYLVAYPGMGDYKGTFNWTSHNQYEREVAAADKTVNALYGKYSKMKVEDVAKDKNAMTIGKNLFDTYCIQCHGSDAQGSRGFPNLTDSDWIYGGTPEKIHETITNGRIGIMMPWGPNLGTEGVRDVANYVMSLSKDRAYDEDRAARGKEIFQANCVACHGANGQGTMGIAPRLNDNIWLWGGSEKAIIETITSGRHNQMPAWKDFLTEDKIHLLTAYVWGKSHPKNQALPTDSTHETGKVEGGNRVFISDIRLVGRGLACAAGICGAGGRAGSRCASGSRGSRSSGWRGRSRVGASCSGRLRGFACFVRAIRWQGLVFRMRFAPHRSCQQVDFVLG